MKICTTDGCKSRVITEHDRCSRCRARRKMVTGTCKKCGVEFEMTHGLRKYCAEHSPAVGQTTRTLFKYGITQATYDAMLEAQGGTCAICPKTPMDNGRAFAVDHDHTCCPGSYTCGKCVRGLLCTSCNIRVGHLEHESVPACLEYIDKFKTVKAAA